MLTSANLTTKLINMNDIVQDLHCTVKQYTENILILYFHWYSWGLLI